jgi:tetratricopeptide (TPR) repeat protein
MLAVVIAFGIHSAVDWTWFFPGVAIPALACAGWLAGRGPLSEPVGRRSAPRRLLAAPAAGGALVAIVAIALGAAWVIWQPLRSANADASAVNALLAGDTHKALDDAHTAVSTDPVSATALWELSEIDLAVGDRPGARQDLVRATSRQPDNPETWQRLGEFDLRYDHPAAAVPELKKAVSLDLTAVQPYWDLADAYAALGQRVPARQALADAIDRQPRNPGSWIRIGQLDLRNGAALVALRELQYAQLLGSTEAPALVAKAQAAVNAQHARAAAAAKRADRRQRGR